MASYDLVIRDGLVVDGSGRPGYRADVAVRDGLIAAVGVVEGRGAQELSAEGLVVTPGFVDIHTHYDGQATWENRLAPSSDHGVTTVVAGNCGVGFAPCRPGDHQKLVKVMEGVEDIPEIVMTEGIPWNWETFPEYMDALSRRELDIDIAVQAPHSPIRVYVMGDRGVNHEPATPEDRARMTEIVAEAIRAGALGVSTSRTIFHQAKDGTLAPSINAADAELMALAEGLTLAKAGVFQLVPGSAEGPEREIGLIRRLAEVSGRPVSFSLAQTRSEPDAWKTMMAGAEAANAAGHQVRAQVIGRPVGILLGLELSQNPFSNLPSYRAIAHLPLAERVAAMRDPAIKALMMSEEQIPDPMPANNRYHGLVAQMFELGAEPDYSPGPAMTLGARAAARAVSPLSLAYDILLKDEGRAILYFPTANFVTGDLSVSRELMAHPDTVLGLGDGGAHYGIICDASYSTHLLTYWLKDAPEGWTFPLEWAVSALTREPAETVGLTDRGVIAVGRKADLNLIDIERLKLHAPSPVYDLPAGGRRLLQKADGYVATIVSGEVTYRNGQATGALPGRLVRGPGYIAA